MTRRNSNSADNGNGNTTTARAALRHPPTALADSFTQLESGQASQRHVQRRMGRGAPRENPLMVAHRSLALVTLRRAYLDVLRVRGYKPKTIRGYELKLRRFTRWAESVGATELQQLSVPLAKDYIAYLQTQRRWMTHLYPKRQPQLHRRAEVAHRPRGAGNRCPIHPIVGGVGGVGRPAAKLEGAATGVTPLMLFWNT